MVVIIISLEIYWSNTQEYFDRRFRVHSQNQNIGIRFIAEQRGSRITFPSLIGHLEQREIVWHIGGNQPTRNETASRPDATIMHTILFLFNNKKRGKKDTDRREGTYDYGI